MTISIGNVTVDQTTSYGVTKTLAHNNNGSGVLVRIALSEETSAVTGLTATYGGVSMTLLGSFASSLFFFWLEVAAQGANNLVVNWTNNAKGGFSVASLTGVSGWRSLDTHSSGPVTTLQVTVTTAPGDMVFDLARVATGATTTVGASQTEQFNEAYALFNFCGSYEETQATSTVMSWTISVAKSGYIAGIAAYSWSSGGMSVSPCYIV